MPFKFLTQPTTGPDSKLCAFYALYHFTDGGVTKETYLDVATSYYQTQLGMDRHDAAALAADGNDPAVFTAFRLTEGDAAAVDTQTVLIVCDIGNGHFFTIRKDAGQWWNYDSFGRSKPTIIGDATAAKKLCGSHPVYHA